MHKLCRVVVWAGLSLVPVAAHADIVVTVSCGSVTSAGGPFGTVTCPGLSSLNSVTLNETTSVSGAMPGTTGGPHPQPIPFGADIFFDPKGPNGVSWTGNGNPGDPFFVTVVVPNPNTQTATAGVTDANFSSAFNVALSSDIFNGSANSMTGAVSVTYQSLLASLGMAPAVTLSCGSLTDSTGPFGNITCPSYTAPSCTTTTGGLVLNSVTLNETTSVSGAMPGTTGGPHPQPIPFAADIFFDPKGPNGV